VLHWLSDHPSAKAMAIGREVIFYIDDTDQGWIVKTVLRRGAYATPLKAWLETQGSYPTLAAAKLACSVADRAFALRHRAFASPMR
jgi:hypothetical protein